MKTPLELTKDHIIHAMRHTKSNKGAARYLGVHLNTYKKYASMYYDEPTGVTLYEKHKNRTGIGIPKTKIIDGKPVKKPEILTEILEGKEIPTTFTVAKLKALILKEGYMAEKCGCCAFEERRPHDYKIPLLLTFRDGNKRNWKLDNLELLCYNCYFIMVGDIFNRKQLALLEDMGRRSADNLQDDLQLEDQHMPLLYDTLVEQKIYQGDMNTSTGEDLIFKF